MVTRRLGHAAMRSALRGHANAPTRQRHGDERAADDRRQGHVVLCRPCFGRRTQKTTSCDEQRSPTTTCENSTSQWMSMLCVEQPSAKGRISCAAAAILVAVAWNVVAHKGSCFMWAFKRRLGQFAHTSKLNGGEANKHQGAGGNAHEDEDDGGGGSRRCDDVCVDAADDRPGIPNSSNHCSPDGYDQEQRCIRQVIDTPRRGDVIRSTTSTDSTATAAGETQGGESEDEEEGAMRPRRRSPRKLSAPSEHLGRGQGPSPLQAQSQLRDGACTHTHTISHTGDPDSLEGRGCEFAARRAIAGGVQ